MKPFIESESESVFRLNGPKTVKLNTVSLPRYALEFHVSAAFAACSVRPWDLGVLLSYLQALLMTINTAEIVWL